MPKYINISGEPVDTKVTYFEARPKRYKKCHKYEHVQNRCSGMGRCGRYSKEGHGRQECQKQEFCFHSGKGHEIELRECTIEACKKEIIKTEEAFKLGRFKAEQILENGIHGNYKKPLKRRSNKMAIKIKEEDDSEKIQVNPFTILLHVRTHLREKPVTLRWQQSDYLQN